MFKSFNADNGQEVLAYEIGFMEGIVYSMAGMEPDLYGVFVFSPEGTPDDPEKSDLENSAPLHVEFFPTEEEAAQRAATVLKHINSGEFVYSPPILPAH